MKEYKDYDDLLIFYSSFCMICSWALSLLECWCIVDVGNLLATLLEGFTNQLKSVGNTILSFIFSFPWILLSVNEVPSRLLHIWNNYVKEYFCSSQWNIFLSLLLLLVRPSHLWKYCNEIFLLYMLP